MTTAGPPRRPPSCNRLLSNPIGPASAKLNQFLTSRTLWGSIDAITCLLQTQAKGRIMAQGCSDAPAAPGSFRTLPTVLRGNSACTNTRLALKHAAG